MTTGRVFDIKRYATGDGPGIRALVFLKGCPLSCTWCANPESQRREAELFYYRNRCIACGRCVPACPLGAIAMDPAGGVATDRAKCTACGRCVAACLPGAREIVGEDRTVKSILSLLDRDRRFYENSGGGVTVTGGEPLFQPAFAENLLAECRSHGLHTAMETCGFADEETFGSVTRHVDLLYYDLKHPEDAEHRAGTGQSNTPILRNLARLREAYSGDLIVRVPYVPGYNTSPDVLRKMLRIARGVPGLRRVEFMPYHRLGLAKYEALGRTCSVAGLEQVDKASLDHLREAGREEGVEVEIDAR